ncbi:CBS domain-containing protein [Microbispora bryophytorum]|nr:MULTISPECIES: CBS domain-containing protein [Microbispora]MBD3135313.1 CBS domain-containing protein [Microbispora bryophytorum]MBD3147584.1 CBS domain-containing protein [Microbispora camponoti]TQS09522.1 CBS domain-containing protein [Microbispora bryophytorum]
MKIKDVMSTPVVVVPPITPVRDVARHMDYSGVGCVVVSEGRGVAGIVTDRDLAVRVLAQDRTGDTPVGQVMSEHPVVVQAEDEVEVAFDTFRRHSFRRLPVDAEGGVVGMLTIDDLLLQMHQLTADLLTPVVKEISEPQHQSD